MTLPVWVPGYLGSITIDATDVSAVGMVLGFDRSKASLPKPTFGSQFRRSASGQISATITFDGHVSPEFLPGLETSFAKSQPIAYIMQIGAALSETDAGQYTGNAIFTALNISGEAEGEFEFSATLETDGDITYTPAA